MKEIKMVDHIHVLNTYLVIGTVNLIIVIFYIQSADLQSLNQFVQITNLY